MYKTLVYTLVNGSI